MLLAITKEGVLNTGGGAVFKFSCYEIVGSAKRLWVELGSANIKLIAKSFVCTLSLLHARPLVGNDLVFDVHRGKARLLIVSQLRILKFSESRAPQVIF